MKPKILLNHSKYQ